MQADNRRIGEKLQDLEGKRATLGEAAYNKKRDELLNKREALDEKWAKLKAECAEHRYDVGNIEGSEPPKPLPPRNDEEAASDERDRAVSRLAAERVEAAEEDRKRAAADKPLETSWPSEALTAVVTAGLGLAARAVAGGIRAGAGALADDLARAAGSTIDDAASAGAANIADDLVAASDDFLPPSRLPQPRFGGQSTEDCVENSARYAAREGLPPNVMSEAGRPGMFNAAAADRYTHVAVRNFDNTITDTTILNNIRRYNNGALPEELAGYTPYDTFDEATHRWLMSYYNRLATPAAPR
jgi:hypothetical protein